VRYCSDACARAAERERTRIADAKRAPRDRSAYAAARYRQVMADPVLHAHRLEVQRRYAAKHREQAREAHRQWRERLRADPVRYEAYLAKERRRKREEARVDPERRRARQRRSYQRLRSDPQRWARFLETHRLEYRLKREQAGHSTRPVPIGKYHPANPQWRVADPEPVRQLVRDWIESGGSLLELSRLSGVSERGLGRLVREQAGLSVASADRIVVALGLHLDLLEAA
jgi:hypothetical protein